MKVKMRETGKTKGRSELSRSVKPEEKQSKRTQQLKGTKKTAGGPTKRSIFLNGLDVKKKNAIDKRKMNGYQTSKKGSKTAEVGWQGGRNEATLGEKKSSRRSRRQVGWRSKPRGGNGANHDQGPQPKRRRPFLNRRRADALSDVPDCHHEQSRFCREKQERGGVWGLQKASARKRKLKGVGTPRSERRKGPFFLEKRKEAPKEKENYLYKEHPHLTV